MTRKNAERFDALVGADRLDLDGVDARTAELLELVGALRAVPAAQPRPEFVTDLRAQLMAAAETELVPAVRSRERLEEKLTVAPRRTHRDRRLSAAIGAIAIVGATSGMAVASQGAIPGDPLYPVKRVIESTQTGFSVSDQAKGRALLANATDRLDEVEQLTRGEDVDADLVRSTLNAFGDQATEASDLLMSDYEDNGTESSVERLRAFTVASVQKLSSLESRVPEGAHDALLAAAQQLFTIDAAAESLCPGCSGEGITEIPGQLLASAETSEEPQLSAEGPLPGTQPSATATEPPASVSGLEPPANPLQVPSIPPLTEVPTSTPSTGQGQQQEQGQQSQQGQQGQQQGQGQQGGQQQLPVKPTPSNLGEAVEGLTGTVNDTVNGTVGTVDDVVGGVVQGVTGVLNGLTGGLLGGQTGQTPAP